MRLHEEEAVIPSMRQANSCEYIREKRTVLKISEIDLAVLWTLCVVTRGHSWTT